MSQSKPWPLGGYAPGSYSCICSSCQKEFVGDKRATQCLECAAGAANAQLEEARRARITISHALYGEGNDPGHPLHAVTDVIIAMASVAASRKGIEAEWVRRLIATAATHIGNNHPFVVDARARLAVYLSAENPDRTDVVGEVLKDQTP